MNTRLCIVCKQSKSLSEFNKGKYRNHLKKDGEISIYKSTQNRCRDCEKKLFKTWYDKKKTDKNWLKRQSKKTQGWYRNNTEYARESSKKRNQVLRLEALKRYGGAKPKCACCGEREICFLAIDHKNNNGNKHRKKLGKTNITRWLRDNNYPSGFQVLCHNCNLAKGFYGKCPHQEQCLSK